MGKHTLKSIARRLRYQVNTGVVTAMFVVWISVLVIAPWYWGGGDLQFKVFGTFLQVIGVVTVAIGIKRTRQDLGDASLFMQLLEFMRFPPPVSGEVNVTLQGLSAFGAAGRISTPEPDNNASVSQILIWVKQQIDLVSQELKAENVALKKQLVAVEERLAAETNNRKELGQQVDKLRKLTTSGLNLSAYGVSCLLVGVVYGTLPAELSGLSFRLLHSLLR